MQTGHAQGDGVAQPHGNQELAVVRAEIEAIDNHADVAGANGSSAAAVSHQLDMRATVDESSIARSEGAAGALRIMELGIRTDLADMEQAVEFARARRAEEASRLNARVAEALHQLNAQRGAARSLNEEAEILQARADREAGEAGDRRKEAFEDRLMVDRQAGSRLMAELEAALDACSRRLAEYDAIIHRRVVRIAILRAELDARSSLMQVGAWSPLFDAGAAGMQANGPDLQVRGRAQRRFLAPTPSVITGDPKFSLEPDPEALEQWELLLFSDAFRRVSRP
jgi:hypothetical protein